MSSPAAASAAASPVEEIAGDPATGILLLCDHASNALPAAYGTLGLPPAELARHIGWDIGAAAVTRGLARRLGAPAVMTTFSRLLIDPNRGEDDPTLVMRLSDGAVVPANADHSPAERAARLDGFHRPYHAAIAARLDAFAAAGVVPMIVSMHSFTPAWKGRPRPWQVGILWDRDPRLAVPLIAALAADPALVVGDNEPYDGALRGDTLHRHGTERGLAHALVEIRQDLIADAAGAEAWADRLAPILARLRRDPAVAAVRHFGSRTDAPATRRGDRARMADTTSPGERAMTTPAKSSDDRPAAAGGLDAATETELEAAVFRRLVEHLRARTDVQNIDLMTLAGFCRNCLSNWYREAAEARGLAVGRDEARTLVYGMPYEEWKARYQTEAAPDKAAAFSARADKH